MAGNPLCSYFPNNQPELECKTRSKTTRCRCDQFNCFFIREKANVETLVEELKVINAACWWRAKAEVEEGENKALRAENERLREALGDIELLRDAPISLECFNGCSALNAVQDMARRAREEQGMEK